MSAACLTSVEDRHTNRRIRKALTIVTVSTIVTLVGPSFTRDRWTTSIMVRLRSRHMVTPVAEHHDCRVLRFRHPTSAEIEY